MTSVVGWEEKSVFVCERVRRSRGDVGTIESIWRHSQFVPVNTIWRHSQFVPVNTIYIQCIRYKMPSVAVLTTKLKDNVVKNDHTDSMADTILAYDCDYDFSQLSMAAYAALSGLPMDLQMLVVEDYLFGPTKPVMRSALCTMLPDCECCAIIQKDEQEQAQRDRKHLRWLASVFAED
jgi:hypothetical protein